MVKCVEFQSSSFLRQINGSLSAVRGYRSNCTHLSDDLKISLKQLFYKRFLYKELQMVKKEYTRIRYV